MFRPLHGRSFVVVLGDAFFASRPRSLAKPRSIRAAKTSQTRPPGGLNVSPGSLNQASAAFCEAYAELRRVGGRRNRQKDAHGRMQQSGRIHA